MPKFYFDTQEGDDVLIDREGLELPDLEAVKGEVALALADFARGVLPGARRQLTIKVRDAQSRRVLSTAVIFDVKPSP
ncbi:hypothetical protein [Mesorhizobium sp.]|uniref:DUF6894 family protein n=1 Tax=Mesorhizobium sp. TaxID=1871066 RepID=UPI000FEA0AD0|nr:hypothetical protein [Mesorhizobium sp.]RWM24438.1 MAG: hypothetical protein EOR74_24440 [Mesorhizobium sp.]RWM34118.1 MAG: hypothetical protein EOR75_26570 [Mesorhizobium sp.]TIO74773.1 MAG: hypothetical protein E5X75_22565 [Mesorhizobium sp.]TIO82615.1 MAG: hypothetical protein E5X74_24110 [Mesorhizobium sp.]TJV49314.1 MAG: hypothetical protein E5Y01_23990 [Mesorhizobium sp.]